MKRSTYYDYQNNVHVRPAQWAEICRNVKKAFEKSHRRFGFRMLAGNMQRLVGVRYSESTVKKAMREMGLKGKYKQTRHKRSTPGPESEKSPNELKRQFEASKPNEKWVTDVTECKVAGKRVFMSVIMDLYSRKIIGRSMSTSPTVEFVLESLRDAVNHGGSVENVLIHSDQGFQYSHKLWRAELRKIGAKQSMSRRGCCYDNAVIESFFGTMKREMFHKEHFDSVDDLVKAVNEYIDWYNEHRSKEVLQWMTPAEKHTEGLAQLSH